MALTDLAIRSAKATNALQKLSDGEGLQLWVQPNGSKLWRMAYRFAGKQKSLAFGSYPEVSLADARKRRDDAKALLASRIDPSLQKRLEKLTKAISAAITFKTVAEELLDKQRREGRSENTITKNRCLLEQAFPAIGERPVAEIKAAEVLAILKHLERRGTLDTAKRVRATIGAVIRYAIATARADTDPTGALAGGIVAPRVKHRAAILDPIELGHSFGRLKPSMGNWRPRQRFAFYREAHWACSFYPPRRITRGGLAGIRPCQCTLGYPS